MPFSDEITEMYAELEAAEAKLAAIDALHNPSGMPRYQGLCSQCDAAWPCPTHRILHPEEEA